MPQRALISIATAVVASLGVLACGGGSGGDDEESAIKGVLERAIVSEDADLNCVQFATASFVKRVYGDVAQCRRAEQSSDDVPATGVAVSDVEVDGDAATAKVRVSGGDNDGSSGTIELRKEDGDWRVDDLGVDYLRSQVRTGLDSVQSSPTLRDPKVRECTRKTFLDLPDPELKRIAYLAIADTAEGKTQLGRLLAPCLSESSGRPGSVSTLRRLFESGVTKKARSQGMSPSTINCINEGLRSSISDDEISKLAFNGSTPTPAMKRAIIEAFGRCQGGEGAQGATVLRELFERGVRQGAVKRGIPKKALDCVIRRLRRSISDDEIVAATTNAAIKARLSRRTAVELLECGAVGR